LAGGGFKEWATVLEAVGQEVRDKIVIFDGIAGMVNPAWPSTRYGVHPAVCAEIVGLLEEETETGQQRDGTARNWGGDSVVEATSTTRERVMAMCGNVAFGGHENLVWRSTGQG